jgi:hypothetical protein
MGKNYITIEKNIYYDIRRKTYMLRKNNIYLGCFKDLEVAKKAKNSLNRPINVEKLCKKKCEERCIESEPVVEVTKPITKVSVRKRKPSESEPECVSE